MEFFLLVNHKEPLFYEPEIIYVVNNRGKWVEILNDLEERYDEPA
jgi:hypothetical protein